MGIAPNFIQKPVTRQADNGKKLFFECLLTADPAPTIAWFRDTQLIQQGGKSMYSVGWKIALLTADPPPTIAWFRDTQLIQQGGKSMYRFRVKHSTVDCWSCSHHSLVQGHSAHPNKEVSPCTGLGWKIALLTADPAPTIAWFRDTQLIQQGGKSMYRFRVKHSTVDCWSCSHHSLVQGHSAHPTRR